MSAAPSETGPPHTAATGHRGPARRGWRKRRWVRIAARAALLAAGYFAFARLSQLLALPPGYASPLWPAAGIAVLGLLRWGRRYWPAVWCGSFAFSFLQALHSAPDGGRRGAFITAAVIAGGAALQAAAGVHFSRWAVARRPLFGRVRDVFGYLLVTGPLACVLSATIGVSHLVAVGRLAASEGPTHWLAWWTGDTLGVLMLAPVAAILLPGRPPRPTHVIRTFLPLAAAGALFVITFHWLDQLETGEFQRRIENETEEAYDRLAAKLVRLQLEAEVAAALIAEHAEVGRPEQDILEQLAQDPETRAILWAPRLPRAGRSAHEDRAGLPVMEWTQEGAVRRAGDRAEYFPVAWAVPGGAAEAEKNMDIASKPEIRAAIDRARETGVLTAAAPIRRSPAGSLEVLLLHPVSAPGASGPTPPEGIAVVIVAVDELLSASAVDPEGLGLDFRLLDVATDGTGILLSGTPEADLAGVSVTREFAIGGRTWNLVMNAHGGIWEPGHQPQVRLYFLASIIGMLLVGAFILAASGREGLISHQVDARTAELRREITDRQKAQTALRLEHAALEAAANAIVITDRNGVIRWANPAFSTSSGFSLPEAIGRKPGALIGSGTHDREFFRAMWACILAGNVWRGEMTNRRKNGSLFTEEMTITPIRDEHGEVEHFVAVKVDVTHRKEAEQLLAAQWRALQQAAEEWSATFDAVPRPLLVIGATGSILRLNRAAQEGLQRPYSGLIGRNLWDVADEEPWRSLASMVSGFSERGVDRLEVVNQKDGRHWDLTIYPAAADALGGGTIALVRDITERTRLEEAARRAESFTTLGHLVGGVIHEVRNPLFAVSATLDAWALEPDLTDSHRQYLTILRGELDRIRRITEDLLQYGRPPDLHRRSEKAGNIMEEAAAQVRVLASTGEIAVAVRDAGRGLAVHADRARLVEALRNLLDNAIRHSPAGGTVMIGAAPAMDLGRFMVEFTVEDAGPGFSTEVLARMFEPFFSKRKGGTGLGLAMVMRTAQQHEGRIAAENRPEGGARLRLLIPGAASQGTEVGDA